MKPPVLHLELTSKCALRCTECARTKYLEKIPIRELSISVLENIKKSGKVFREVSLCGAHGDPIYHSNFHSILKILNDFPGQPLISIATNGSYRSEDWWKETALLLARKDEIIFAVDGLKDTLNQYRVNADWDSIRLGMETVKKHSRVRLIWQWILFRHNEHQLEEAGKLAKEWKVDQFLLLKSSRYSKESAEYPMRSTDIAQEEFRRGFDLSSL